MEKTNPPAQHGQKEGIVTSGANLSYWIESVLPIRFSPLGENVRTEVVVVGGGIAGLSVAYALVKAGKRVIVLEDGFIGSGETGRTTAHLSNALDDRYSEIERLLGSERCRLAAESHTAAIDFIERAVEQEGIDCDFKRVDGYLFLHPSDNPKTIDEEYFVTNKYGIRTERIESIPGLPDILGPCLRFPGQAQFHPMKYLRGLANFISKNGGVIHTETHVEAVHKNGVRTNRFAVQAQHVVVATNTPFNDLVTMHTKQYAYRTYVIGMLVPKDAVSTALYWDTGNLRSTWTTDPYHYVRIQPHDDTHDLLIAGGEDHKTGQAARERLTQRERYAKLEHWVRNHFPAVTEVTYRWSGQVMEPVDYMGFIGRNPGENNVYIATGDSGNGMTHGTIAGILIPDLIMHKSNPWEKLYDPSRITMKAADNFLKEAGNMAAQYLDYLEAGDIHSLNELKPDTGAIINVEGKKIAVYKDEKEMLHTFSAVCPHLGCILQWNGDERTFDCPCHGSRFTCHGSVVNGPAKTDLTPIEMPEKLARRAAHVGTKDQ